jgi:1-acyl-sn-glycerol-3-phosphate acyltransferase
MPSRSRYTSPLHAAARSVAQRGLLKPLVWRLVTVTVLGKEHLDGLNRPFVIVSNHASHLDAPLILGSLPRKLASYVAAGAAADYFFDVWWRKGLTSLFFNAFPVDRTGLRGRQGLATNLLDDGVPLLLFPEGTRSRTGDMAAFKPGAAALSISRDVPCLPVAIVGAAEAMPYGQNLADSRTAAGVRHLRGADARRGRRDGRPVLRTYCQRGTRTDRLRHDLPRQPVIALAHLKPKESQHRCPTSST